MHKLMAKLCQFYLNNFVAFHLLYSIIFVSIQQFSFKSQSKCSDILLFEDSIVICGIAGNNCTFLVIMLTYLVGEVLQ